MLSGSGHSHAAESGRSDKKVDMNMFATAAILLARAGWSVVVIERKDFPRRKVCGEYLSATNLPLLEQLGVSATLDDAAVLDDHDAIGVLDRRQSMRNDQRRAVVHQLFERRLNEALRLGIER